MSATAEVVPPPTKDPKIEITYHPIYQQRFYLDEHTGWTDWEITSAQGANDIRQYISWGKRYQLRTLVECLREGYNVAESYVVNPNGGEQASHAVATPAKVCDNKVDGVCQRPNRFCVFPKCEQ